MLTIILIFNLLFSQEIDFNIRDKINGEKIQLDSIKFYNQYLDIDTTMIYSDKIDLTDILIMNSIEDDEKFRVSLNNSQLKIHSEEIIDNVSIYNLLGVRIGYFEPNSKSFESTLYSNINIAFVQINSNKNRIVKKLINSYSNVFSYNTPITKVISSNWQLTYYKYGFTTTTMEYDELPKTLDYILERTIISLSSSISFRYNIKARTYFNGKFLNTDSDFSTTMTNSINIYQDENLTTYKCSRNSKYEKDNPMFYFNRCIFSYIDKNEKAENSIYKSEPKTSLGDFYVMINNDYLLSYISHAFCNSNGNSILYYEFNDKIDLKPLLDNKVDSILVHFTNSDLKSFNYSLSYSGQGDTEEKRLISGPVNGSILLKLVK